VSTGQVESGLGPTWTWLDPIYRVAKGWTHHRLRTSTSQIKSNFPWAKLISIENERSDGGQERRHFFVKDLVVSTKFGHRSHLG